MCLLPRLVLVTAGCFGLASSLSVSAQLPTSQLKNFADAHDVELCATVNHNYFGVTNYRNAARDQFHWIKPEYEMKVSTIRTSTGGWNFGPCDAVFDRAELAYHKVHGHALIWYKYGPSWLSNPNSTNVKTALRDHIAGVVNRYKNRGSTDRVPMWDVVNESLRDSRDTARGGNWYTQWFRDVADGNLWAHFPDYIAESFRRARELDGNAILIYNDYNIETDDPANSTEKSDAAFEMCDELLSLGVPIDGIGFQCHFKVSTWDATKRAQFADNLRRFAQLKNGTFKIVITELDVRFDDSSTPTTSELIQQGNVYYDVIATALLEPNCSQIQFWGITDNYTSTEPTFNDKHQFLLDESYAGKNAFWRVRDLLRDGVLAHGPYKITNRQSGKVLRVKDASTANNQDIVQYSYANYDSYKWTFSLGSGRSYRFENLNSQKSFRALNNSTGNGTIIQQIDNDQDYYTVRHAGGGWYYFAPTHNVGQRLYVANQSTANNAQIKQQTDYSSSAQWKIEEAN